MIASKQNQTFKRLMKLKKSKYRQLYQEAIVFGEDILFAARTNDLIIETISGDDNNADIILSKTLFDELSDYQVSPRKAAVIAIRKNNRQSDKVLVCENIQDPRNLGALLRSAHAFGFHHVMMTPQCVDPYHEIALRSAKGSTFYLNIEEGSIESIFERLKKLSFEIISTTPKKTPVTTLKYPKLALVLGNEGSGVSEFVSTHADHFLHIPTQEVESLNVSVAGAIAMYIVRGQ